MPLDDKVQSGFGKLLKRHIPLLGGVIVLSAAVIGLLSLVAVKSNRSGPAGDGTPYVPISTIAAPTITMQTPTVVPTLHPVLQVMGFSEMKTTLDSLVANYQNMPKEDVWRQVAAINEATYTRLTGKKLQPLLVISDNKAYDAELQKQIGVFGEAGFYLKYLKGRIGLTVQTGSGVKLFVKGEDEEVAGKSANPLFLLRVSLNEVGVAEFKSRVAYESVPSPEAYFRFSEVLSYAYTSAALSMLQQENVINLNFPGSDEGKAQTLNLLDALTDPSNRDALPVYGWQALWKAVLSDSKLADKKAYLLEHGRLTPKQGLEVRDYLLAIAPSNVPGYLSGLPDIAGLKSQMLQVIGKRYDPSISLEAWPVRAFGVNIALP